MNPKPPPPIRSEKHRRFVASLPCCISGRDEATQGHHLLRVPEKCMGRRAGDNWIIPLHHEMHTALHRSGDETAFLAIYDIGGPALAKALWNASGNYELACAILRGLQQEKAS